MNVADVVAVAAEQRGHARPADLVQLSWTPDDEAVESRRRNQWSQHKKEDEKEAERNGLRLTQSEGAGLAAGFVIVAVAGLESGELVGHHVRERVAQQAARKAPLQHAGQVQVDVAGLFVELSQPGDDLDDENKTKQHKPIDWG